MSANRSEWGKVSEGQSYGLIATDFGRALYSAGLGRSEMMFMGYMMERSWSTKRRAGRGWPDPAPVVPNFNELARAWGVLRQSLNRANHSLVAKRILVETPAGLLINKNASEWIDPESGGPLLTPEATAYAVAARQHQRCLGGNTNVASEATPALRGQEASRQHQRCLGGNTNVASEATPALPPSKEERAAEDLSRGRLNTPELASPPRGGRDSFHDESIRVAGDAWGPAAAAAMERDADGLTRRIGGRFDCLLAAVKKIRDEGKPVRDLRKLAIAVANRIADEGLPVSVAPAAKPSMAERKARARAAMDAHLRKTGELT